MAYSMSGTIKRNFIYLTEDAFVMPPHPQGRGNKRCFCPSVCPSVAYIVNNPRTQTLACPNLEGRFPTLDDTRPINADTQIVAISSEPEVYELQPWYTDGERRPASATGAMTSKVKGQGHKLTSSVHLILICLFFIRETKFCICVIRGGVAYRVGRTRRPQFLLFGSLVRCQLEYANSVWDPYIQRMKLRPYGAIQIRLLLLLLLLNKKSKREPLN